MKNLISRIVLFASLALTGVFVQCSTSEEDVVMPVSLNSSADNRIAQDASHSEEYLAADTSFIELVIANKIIINKLNHKLKTLGNRDARSKQSERIAAIHSKKEITNADFILVVRELGFSDIREYVELTSEVFKRTEELGKKGIDLGTLNKEVYSKAYNSAAGKLDFGVASYDVCVECPFNNCNECWGSGGTGGDDQLDQPGGGGGGTVNCKTACETIRNSKKGKAEMDLAVNLTAVCGSATYTAWKIGSCLGLLGAATGGVCTAAVCGSIYYYNYVQDIQIIDQNMYCASMGVNKVLLHQKK